MGELPQYLLAEDFCVHILSRQSAMFAQKFDRLPFGQVGMSSITFGNLLVRAQGLPRPAEAMDTVEAFARLVPPLPFDNEQARILAELSSRLRDSEPVDPALRMVVAQALTIGATLVTRDYATYTRVPRLRVEDWSR